MFQVWSKRGWGRTVQLLYIDLPSGHSLGNTQDSHGRPGQHSGLDGAGRGYSVPSQSQQHTPRGGSLDAYIAGKIKAKRLELVFQSILGDAMEFV